MNDLLKEFVAETREILDGLGQSVLGLEGNPFDRALLNAVFRSVHTMKGASGLFDIMPFTRVVHAAEEVLDLARESKIQLDPEIIDVVLAVIDQIGTWIDELEAGESLSEDAPRISDALRERLQAFLEPLAVPGSSPEAVTATRVELDWWREHADAMAEVPLSPGSVRFAIAYRPDPQACFTGGDPLLTVRQIQGVERTEIVRRGSFAAGDNFDPYVLALEFRVIAVTSESELEGVFRYVMDEVDWEEIARVERTKRPVIDRALIEEAIEVLVAQEELVLVSAGARDPGTAESIASVLLRLFDRFECGGCRAGLEAVLAGKSEATEFTSELAALKDHLHALLRPEDVNSASEGVPDDQESADTGAASSAAVASQASGGRQNQTPQKALRVDQERIDQLMNLIGELVVAKNGLPYLATRAEDVFGARELGREIKSQFGALNRIAEDLQSAVMQIRMVTLARVFQRFPRLVRDLARKTNKEVQLIIEGEEAEIDKNSVDDLGEPLIHMIRNSVDHGIELPDVREAAGKPRIGTIRIVARQLDDKVQIDVSDDGAGIDPARVVKKAIEKGLITAEAGAAMTEREALELILRPGFSTAEQVSELSGRGVGMDVVRSMVQNLGGQLSMRSTVGVGTTISFSIPLSVAVTRMMMVEVAGECFGIPMEAVLETVRLPCKARHKIHGGEAIVLRDRLIPVCRMRQLLDLAEDEGRASDLEELYLVVRIKGERLALVVDRVHEGIDTIVKPLDGVLAGLRLYAGTAILGDGRILLELNMEEVAQCLS